jgi:hypothetical protein
MKFEAVHRRMVARAGPSVIYGASMMAFSNGLKRNVP